MTETGTVGELLAGLPAVGPKQRGSVLGSLMLHPDTELAGLEPHDREWLDEVIAFLRANPSDDTVIKEVSPDDWMYRKSGESYFATGRNALKSIRLAMLESGKSSFESILDFGCGFGRVLRMLKAAFPEARLTACDIRRDGVDFCAAVLGATPVYSSLDVNEIDLEGPFDLIFCGSVFTHFDAGLWSTFLPYFESLLMDQGLILFTTQGRRTADLFRRRELEWGLTEEGIQKMLSDYDDTGFGFSSYSGNHELGISLSKPSWVLAQIEKLPSLRLVTYRELILPRQDTVGCIRIAES
jgi:SAM-dependent methyltransferase